jgi:hypothetical protein
MDLLRQIKYRFPAEFLKFRTISTTLTFRVGNSEVKNFRMIGAYTLSCVSNSK